MYKHINKITLIVLVSLFTGAFLSCSDEIWQKHYNADPSLVSDKNLWQTIESTPDLSTFAKVLKNHGYDKVLSQSQAYTVFAPDNTALQFVDTGDVDVAKKLIDNHVARYIYTISEDHLSTVATLNGKRIRLQYNDGKFSYGTAGFASPLKTVVASNGLLHQLVAVEPFFPNIYEYLAVKGNELDSLKNYIYAFSKRTFVPELSVPGSTVNGELTYLDSVFVNQNTLLNKIGYINVEDSSYTFLAPNNMAWIEAYNRIKQYYTYYNVKRSVADSMQRANTTFSLVKDLCFSNSKQKSTADSLISTSYNTFYKPQYLFDGTNKVTASNGDLYVSNALKIDALDSWHKFIKVEGEDVTGRENTLSTPTVEKPSYGGQYISDQRYLKLTPTGTTSNPTVTFQIPGTLSSTYDIYCVFVSQKTVNPNATGVKPFKVFFNLICSNALGVRNLTSPYRYPAGSATILTNTEKNDTVLVTSNFKFPVANYGENVTTVTLQVQSSVLRSETSTYSRELAIDCIFLKPRK